MVIPRKWPIYPAETAPSRADCAQPVQLAKFAQLAMGVMVGDIPLSLDGINERGLAGAVFYYPSHAHYPPPVAGKAPLDPSFALQYALSTCADLAEVERMFRDKTTLSVTMPSDGTTHHLHFLFSDLTGEAMVIEPDAEGLKIYRNTIGVLTNSPGYCWQETNIRNYLGVSREPRQPFIMEGHNFQQISANAALWGLPGDYSSVSRFVKTAYLKRFVEQPQNEADCVTTAFHVLSAVSVPRFGVGRDEAEAGYTMYTAAMSACSRSYYFHTYENRRIQAASLEREDLDAAEIKFYKWSDEQDIAWRGNHS